MYMKKYKIKIEERLVRIIEVEAETKRKAIDKIMDQYMNEKIILGSEDYESTYFDTIKDTKKDGKK